MLSHSRTIAVVFLTFVLHVFAALNATENASQIILRSDRLYVSFGKSISSVDAIRLDGQDLLGPKSGNTGIGPYLDCYCTPQGFYTPGSTAPKWTLITGTDSSNVSYAGVKLAETYTVTGQVFEQYWFLPDGEIGLHMFSRLAYFNEEVPFLRNLQELRTLFRPNTPLWTHLSTNEEQYAPLPSRNATSNQVTVQDATWYLGRTPNDPYVQQESAYFTKYMFSDVWKDHTAHGLYSDGSTSSDGSKFGAWLVHNTIDTYFGGPLHSDLTVDGIVYNYIVSNHHGAGTPNITDGFDRTFGPQFYYFNKGSSSSSLAELRGDASRFASPTWNSQFYDSIAKHVTGYIPTSNRGALEAQVELPEGALNAVAVLAQNGVDFQDNAIDTTAYQYWAYVKDGSVEIPRVKAGTYRLTIYAEGIFGQYTQDNIEVTAGEETSLSVQWEEDTAGTELWRIGTPDKSSGEYRHGYAKDTDYPLQPAEHLLYWAVHDFPTDFPDGVNFTVGESDIATDLNYVHWSVFGGYANNIRTEPFYENVNNWTINFDIQSQQLADKQQATFSVLLAGAKTAAGNTDTFNASEPHANLAYTVNVNGQDLEPWYIPYNQSSSCAVRSAVVCYNVGHKFEFSTSLLKTGGNTFVLSLPANATNYEPALLPRSTYVQYDALRLEVS